MWKYISYSDLSILLHFVLNVIFSWLKFDYFPLLFLCNDTQKVSFFLAIPSKELTAIKIVSMKKANSIYQQHYPTGSE